MMMTNKSRNTELRAVTAARWLLLSTVLVPLIIWPTFFFPYITPRTVFFRTVVDLVVGIFVYLVATREHESVARRDSFLWAFLAFTIASGLAAVVSSAPNRAMFGDFERMGGVWALLHYLLYYVMLRTFFGAREWKYFLRASVVVSAVVSLIAMVQYFVAFAGTPLAGTFYSAVFATIGNPGMLGMYLFFGVGFAAYLAFTAQDRRIQILFALVALIDFYGIILSQNRTTVLGVVVALATGALAYAVVGSRYRSLVLTLAFATAALFSTGLAVAIKAPNSAVAKQLPGIFNRAAQTTMAGPDAIRFLQWRAAVEGFRDHPLVGYGPENFHLAWSAHFQPALYGKITEERLDRTHNAYLEVLSTTGLIGTIAFIALWVALFAAVWKSGKEKRISPAAFSFFLALFSGYAVILVFWFFDINSVPLWLGACALFTFLNSEAPLLEFHERKVVAGRSRLLIGAGGIVLASALWLHTFETMRVAHLLFRTQAVDTDPGTTLHDYFKVFDSPAPQTSHTTTMYGRYMTGLATRSTIQIQSDPALRKLVDTAFARGIVEMERERKRDPLNELVYIQQARLSLLAASYYGLGDYYKYAITTLQKAVALNPRRMQPRMVLAYALMMGGRLDEAHGQLMQAKSIYAKSGQVYYYLAHLRRLEKNFPAAAAALDTSFMYGHSGDVEVYTAVIQGLEAEGNFAVAARVIEGYLKTRVRTYLPEGSHVLRVPSPGVETELLARLPVLWARAGNTSRVAAALNNLVLADHRYQSRAEQFAADFQNGNIDRWIKAGTLFVLNPLPAA